MKDQIVKQISSSIEIKQRVLQDETIIAQIQIIVKKIVNVFQAGGKVLFCGNGGSAADAQHLAAELSGRYYYDRPPLYSEALHVNTSYLTAVANDYSYDEIYARLVRAMGRSGDVLVGISTSGNSANVIKAIDQANELGMLTIGMTGGTGGKMNDICQYTINIPTSDTPRVQECHIMIGHIICELIEKEIFPRGI